MSKTFPLLFGRASKGKVKVWSVIVMSAGRDAHLTITHGEEGGKQQSTTRTIKVGKNVGKANETSPWEQAVSEAESLWKKKQDKGYTTTRTAVANKNTAITKLPMLAHKYTERKHKLVWPVFVQPKLNGIRCLIERSGDTITFLSRGGKVFTTMDHLIPDCLAVMNDGDILDGELYNHDLSFQEICSIVKNEGDNDLPRRKLIQFWNYDRADAVPFRERLVKLKNMGNIVRVSTYEATGDADVQSWHNSFVADGYEGIIIRSGGDEPYVFQYRSNSLLKLKNFEDDEFEIIGVKQADGKAIGQAVFSCVTKDGVTFDVRCKGTDDSRREQWRNRSAYIGQMLIVRFQNYSNDGSLVFPVGLGVRDYE